MATTAERCASVVTLKRADELCLGDQIILSHWDGRWTVVSVTGLRLLNDTVEISYPNYGEVLCKAGVGFHVVALNERFK